MAGAKRAVARLLAVAAVASGQEALAFALLSLVLQAGLAYRYVAPVLARFEVQETHVVLAVLFVHSLFILPALAGAHAALTAGAQSAYSERISRLPKDGQRRVTTLLVAVFLATVCKVPSSVRFELATAYALAYAGAISGCLFHMSVLEAFADAFARQAAVSLALHAVVPGFDGTFGHMVRTAAAFALAQAQRAHTLIMRR